MESKIQRADALNQMAIVFKLSRGEPPCPERPVPTLSAAGPLDEHVARYSRGPGWEAPDEAQEPRERRSRPLDLERAPEPVPRAVRMDVAHAAVDRSPGRCHHARIEAGGRHRA